jgi:hypothetical protein
MKTISQSIKSQIRTEIRTEIETAIAISATKGTVVTSRGDCLSFRIERMGSTNFVHIGGYWMLDAKEAAASAMLSLGYTRS